MIGCRFCQDGVLVRNGRRGEDPGNVDGNQAGCCGRGTRIFHGKSKAVFLLMEHVSDQGKLQRSAVLAPHSVAAEQRCSAVRCARLYDPRR